MANYRQNNNGGFFRLPKYDDLEESISEEAIRTMTPPFVVQLKRQLYSERYTEEEEEKRRVAEEKTRRAAEEEARRAAGEEEAIRTAAEAIRSAEEDIRAAKEEEAENYELIVESAEKRIRDAREILSKTGISDEERERAQTDIDKGLETLRQIKQLSEEEERYGGAFLYGGATDYKREYYNLKKKYLELKKSFFRTY